MPVCGQTVFLVFPKAHSTNTWPPPFRVCWMSATTVDSDFILLEPVDEWQFLVGNNHVVVYVIVFEMITRLLLQIIS